LILREEAAPFAPVALAISRGTETAIFPLVLPAALTPQLALARLMSSEAIAC